MVNKIPSSFKIFLIGSLVDIPLCESIKDKSMNKNVEVLAGKLSFLQSAALIKNARMTFANDSAPLHFASAMNSPVGAIFCSTVPGFGFGPLSERSFIFETNEKLTCRPCGLHVKNECPEKHFKCSDIDIDMILKKTGIL